MKKYEGLFIVKPNLSKEEMEKASSAIAEVIVKSGGVVENKEDMGLRQLAYDIKRERQGHYLLIYFMANPKAISDMEKTYKLNESILRALVLNRSEK